MARLEGPSKENHYSLKGLGLLIAPLIFLDFPTALESSCAPRKHVPALLSIIFKEYVDEEKLNEFEFVMGKKGNQQKSLYVLSGIFSGNCHDHFNYNILSLNITN